MVIVQKARFRGQRNHRKGKSPIYEKAEACETDNAMRNRKGDARENMSEGRRDSDEAASSFLQWTPRVQT